MNLTFPENALFAAVKTPVGRIVFRLLEEEAPAAVAHFVGLASGSLAWRHPVTGELQQGRPLYDGTQIHRAVPSGFIQFGDPCSLPDGDASRVGQGGPGFAIADEIHPRRRFDRPGIVAFANEGRRDSIGSQLFIAEVALPHLQGRHTIFGDVVHGFERVPKLSRRVAAGESIVIERVELVRGKF